MQMFMMKEINVSNITVFQNSIITDSRNESSIRLASSYEYSSLSEVKIYGQLLAVQENY